MIRGIIFPTQDGALVQGRGRLGFDMAVKEFAVYRTVDDPRRVQPVMAQRGDEGPAPDVIRGLPVPVAEAGVIHQPHPAWRPSGRLGHVGLERGFAARTFGSSMKPIRVSMLRMKGWRRLIQTSRASATSGRFGSFAIVLEPMAHQWRTAPVFFRRQAEAAQVPPDRDAAGRQIETRGAATRCPSRSSATRSSRVRSRFSVIRRSVQPTTPANLPCPPPLPWGLAASPPVAAFKSTMSLTNLIETRNRAAAARCVCPCSTNATTR